MGQVARSYDPAAGEVLSVEVEINGPDAARLRDYAARFGYSSLAAAIVALVSCALDSTS